MMELRGSANLFYFTARRNLFNGQQRKDGTQRTVLWIRVHHGATEIGDCSKQLGGYIGPDVHFDLILGVDPRGGASIGGNRVIRMHRFATQNFSRVNQVRTHFALCGISRGFFGEEPGNLALCVGGRRLRLQSRRNGQHDGCE